MKKITREKRNAMVFALGIVCALLGPLVGWQVTGLCPGGFDLFLQHYPAKAVVWVVIGFGVGFVAGALLSTLDFIKQRDMDEESKANRS